MISSKKTVCRLRWVKCLRELAVPLGSCTSDAVQRRLKELEDLDAASGRPNLEADVDLLSTMANETWYKIIRVLHTAARSCVSVSSRRYLM